VSIPHLLRLRRTGICKWRLFGIVYSKEKAKKHDEGNEEQFSGCYGLIGRHYRHTYAHMKEAPGNVINTLLGAFLCQYLFLIFYNQPMKKA